MIKCGPACSAAAHLPALPHPLGYFWPGKLVPTRFSALLNALQHKTNMSQELFFSVADPGFGAFLTPGSWIRDGQKSRSGSGMTSRIIFPRASKQFFGVKNT
jgi:hypothetical protein